MNVGHVHIKFLIQEIIELTHVRYCYCEAEVRSSSVSVVYVVCLHIVSKAALQKRSSMEPMKPLLHVDPPLLMPIEDTGDSTKACIYACVYTLSLQWHLFTDFMTSYINLELMDTSSVRYRMAQV